MNRINRTLLFMMAFVFLLTAACSAEPQVEAAVAELPAAEVITQSNSVDDTQPNPSGRNESGGFGSTQLIFGMFQLESTDYAITPEQAAELAPLWKVYQSLLESSTAAEAEREALLNQITGVLTPEQQEKLDSGEIDPADTQALMAELGIEVQNPGMGRNTEGENGEALTDAEREEMKALRETMGGSGGGPGGGMGQDMDPEQLATLQAERAADGGGIRGGGQMDDLLLPALIELLESKL
jgi:hypothetical protein